MTAATASQQNVLERVKDAWRPRFLANGVELYDYETTTKRIERWDEWLPEWRKTAAEHVAAAREAEAAGHLATAAWERRLAALCLLIGHFNTPEPEADWLAAQREKAALFRTTLAYLDPSAERVEIPFERITLPAHLRTPHEGAVPPVVLFLSGLDSTKEEHTLFENVLLARGLATLTFDGPGQGETWEKMPGRVDWEKAASAVIDWVERRSDLDAGRIVAVGVSLGGYLVARCASFDKRIKATACIGGTFDQSHRGKSDPMHTPRFLHFWNVRTEEEGRPFMAASTLEGVIEKLDRPLLVVHGERDTIAPPESARKMFERAGGPKRLVMYPEGNHVCNNIAHRYRPLVADWLAEQIGVRR